MLAYINFKSKIYEIDRYKIWKISKCKIQKTNKNKK